MIEFYKEIPPWAWVLAITMLTGGFLWFLNRFIKKNDEYWERTINNFDKIDESFEKVNDNMNKLITENRVQGYRIAHMEREISIITGRPIVNYP